MKGFCGVEEGDEVGNIDRKLIIKAIIYFSH